MLPFRSQVTRTKRKTPLELKVELASLKLSNEQLTKENEALNKINTLKLKQIKRYQLQLRGAHVSLTKLRKRLDLQCVVQRRSKYSLKESLGRRQANLCFHFAGSGENLPDIAKSRDASMDNKEFSSLIKQNSFLLFATSCHFSVEVFPHIKFHVI